MSDVFDFVLCRLFAQKMGVFAFIFLTLKTVPDEVTDNHGYDNLKLLYYKF